MRGDRLRIPSSCERSPPCYREMMDDPLNLPKGWTSIDDVTGIITFTKELRRELCASHALYGTWLLAVARKDDRDDFLFCFEDGVRVVQVHLTWREETAPNWPKFIVFDNLDRWCSEVCDGAV